EKLSRLHSQFGRVAPGGHRVEQGPLPQDRPVPPRRGRRSHMNVPTRPPAPDARRRPRAAPPGPRRKGGWPLRREEPAAPLRGLGQDRRESPIALARVSPPPLPPAASSTTEPGRGHGHPES